MAYVCSYCSRKFKDLLYRCNYCGESFCFEHRLPPNHSCSNIKSWESYSGPTGGEPTPSYIPDYSKPHHYRLSKRAKRVLRILGFTVVLIGILTIANILWLEPTLKIVPTTEVFWNTNEYLNKEITIEGRYVGNVFGPKNIGSIWSGGFFVSINASDIETELKTNEIYRLKGILIGKPLIPTLIVSQVLEVTPLYLWITVLSADILTLAYILSIVCGIRFTHGRFWYRRRQIPKVPLAGIMCLAIGFIMMRYPEEYVISITILLGGAILLFLVFVKYVFGYVFG